VSRKLLRSREFRLGAASGAVGLLAWLAGVPMLPLRPAPPPPALARAFKGVQVRSTVKMLQAPVRWKAVSVGSPGRPPSAIRMFLLRPTDAPPVPVWDPEVPRMASPPPDPAPAEGEDPPSPR
jgi:hypothetical protein